MLGRDGLGSNIAPASSVHEPSRKAAASQPAMAVLWVAIRAGYASSTARRRGEPALVRRACGPHPWCSSLSLCVATHQHAAALSLLVQEQQGLGVRLEDGAWQWKEGDPLAEEVAKELLDLNTRLAESPVRGAAAGVAHAPFAIPVHV